MPTDILVTGWAGSAFGMMACHTIPLMERYAERHGMALFVANLTGPRKPSWMKVPNIIGALDHYERAVWIDADVVINRFEENILDDVPHYAAQALVPHETPCGVVPNCGVWVVTQQMRDTLRDIWTEDRNLEHFWWEQASMLEKMGYEVTADERGFPLCQKGEATPLRWVTEFLDAKWNHHPQDANRVDAPNFIHVTGYGDRISAVKRLCSHIKDLA